MYVCDAADILQANEISKMMAHNKRVIDDKLNSLLLGKGSNNRRETGENKSFRALNLGGPEDEKRS